MAPSQTLRIKPDDLTEREDWIPIVQQACDTLRDTDLAIYTGLPDECEPVEAFVARTPQHALQWICRRVSRPQLIRIIQHIYDYPDVVIIEDGEGNEDVRMAEHDPPSGQEAASIAGENTQRMKGKRKRVVGESNTRSVNKALVEKMNLALVQTVANTQDWESAKAPEAITVGEQKYRNFAKRLPGLGITVTSQMISKAVAIGTMEVFEDWQAILTVWKRQNAYGKRLFQGVAGVQEAHVDKGIISQSQSTISTDSPSNAIDEAGLTYLETETFRLKYFEAQKTQVDGIADEMRHRWKMDALFEEYDKLEKEIRRRNEGTGARGRRYPTVAKEYLFASAYSVDLGRRPSKETDPDLWIAFGQYLDWGKRWNMVKKRFDSVGIFGLLPRSIIANVFVEKTLNQTRLAQWIEMVAECNHDVATMAVRMEPLFLACMEESRPPSEFKFLEHLDKFRGHRPLALFDADDGLNNTQLVLDSEDEGLSDSNEIDV